MNLETLAQDLLDNPDALAARAAALSDADAAALVDWLKAEADRHWWINANRSLDLADLISRVARARGDRAGEALGLMARGDALRYLGRAAEAWELLGQAGAIFQDAGEPVGWARTRIGRLSLCVDQGRTAEALEDAERARAVFEAAGEVEKLMRLDLNLGAVYYVLGDLPCALRCYTMALRHGHRARATPSAQAGTVATNMALLYNNIGTIYAWLGDFRRARRQHERARALMVELRNERGLALAEINIAYILMSQGHYRSALRLLHSARGRPDAAQLALDAALDTVQCYLPLNRFAEARDVARDLAEAYRAQGVLHQEVRALLFLSTAQAELGDLDGAAAALDAAETRLRELDAPAKLSFVRLRRGQIALRQGDPAAALREGAAARASFEQHGQQLDGAAALLLCAQAHLAAGETAAAASAGQQVLGIARRCNALPLRYSAHLLLGRVAEVQGLPLRAAREFSAAFATIERVQRGLTITLRPGFLEDKGEAVRHLIGLHLEAGRAARAFETLERERAQVLLSYLTDREQLRWVRDERGQTLIAELERLREEHQWFYRLAQDTPAGAERPAAITPAQARAELTVRERQMRAITERLYLEGDRRVAAAASPPSLRALQDALDEQTLLIEFYNDGGRLWAFALDRGGLEHHPLPLVPAALDRLTEQFQRNLAFALSAGPEGARRLSAMACQILQRLYAGLLAPLAGALRDRPLVLVPYGALHYLPLHLLHSGASYLVERQPVRVLPSAALLTRPGPTRAPGVRGLAHSWHGHLPHTQDEVRCALALFGGSLHAEQQAARSVLEATPAQILHIAAHGEHRLDQPELSYIELADGQIYTDDLLQYDLGYELVVLSACETGRARVSGGGELIGLGRGFLYAGAGALLASLWRVDDLSTLKLMEHFYAALQAGAPKSAALRSAQCRVLAGAPDLHPAFWGAFQLVGDDRPLSHLAALGPARGARALEQRGPPEEERKGASGAWGPQAPANVVC
jgi:CHAT domain-containing protein/tetratricopeptide (TPR) repeat protein